MKIQRLLQDHIKTSLQPGKVLVLYGPRRVGKTTLLNDMLTDISLSYNFVSGDQLPVREVLSSQNLDILKTLILDRDMLIIDEAQRIDNIGLNLKILVDNFPQKYFIATGSASFDLANKVAEPLTGRKTTLLMYPVSFGELQKNLGLFKAQQQLERWLIWGAYPEAVSIQDPEKRKKYLDELTGSYLYKDILELEGVRHPEKIVNILRLLAFQIGQEVSLAEIASNVALNRETVERYLDLLEKSFVIMRRGGFSRNLRKEIVKNSRYYFFDNGVRNSLIQNFNPLPLRDDVGSLWDNFLTMERLKAHAYADRFVNSYFWRTYEQQEIDLVEERDGKLLGFEFKWSPKKPVKAPKQWLGTYSNASFEVITPENYLEFVT